MAASSRSFERRMVEAVSTMMSASALYGNSFVTLLQPSK